MSLNLRLFKSMVLAWPSRRGFLFGIVAVAALSPSCGGKSNQTSAQKSGPNGEVQVTGEVSSEDPTEFTQADESVQIGGVNLASATTNKIEVNRLRDGVGVYSGSSSSASFSFKVAATDYLVVTVTKSVGVVFRAILPPAFEAQKAILKVNNISTVAAKAASLLVVEANKGNTDAATLMNERKIPMASLLTMAESVVKVVNAQKQAGKPATPVDLTQLTKLWASSAAAYAQANPTASSTVYSAAAYDQIFSTDAPVSTLAYRANDTGSVQSSGKDPAYEAIKALAYEPLIAAYQNGDTLYRKPDTLAAAVANEATSQAVYNQTYSTCTTALTTCADPNYSVTPPPSDVVPPPDSSTSSGDPAGTSGSGTKTPTEPVADGTALH